MSDSEEQRLTKIIEESTLAIKDASSKLDQIAKEKGEAEIKELRQKVEDLVGFELEQSNEELAAANKKQEEIYEKIVKNLEEISKVEWKIRQRIPHYKSENEEFKREKKEALEADIRKWLETRKEHENSVLKICGLQQ